MNLKFLLQNANRVFVSCVCVCLMDSVKGEARQACAFHSSFVVLNFSLLGDGYSLSPLAGVF